MRYRSTRVSSRSSMNARIAVTTLKGFVEQRRAYLLNHPEIVRLGQGPID